MTLNLSPRATDGRISASATARATIPCLHFIEYHLPGRFAREKRRARSLFLAAPKICSRGDFKGGAAVVFAEVAGDAEQVAFAVQDHAVEGLHSAVGEAEVMQHAVFPLAVLLRRQFENHAASIASAIAGAASGRPVEVASFVQCQRAFDHASLQAIGKVVEDCFFPLAAGEGELEDGAMAVASVAPTARAAEPRTAIEVPGCVHD